MTRQDIPDSDTSNEDRGTEEFEPRRCDCDHCRSQGSCPVPTDCLFGGRTNR